jgi:hypothetical protein
MKVINEPVQIDCLDKPRTFLLDMPAALRIEDELKINVLRDCVGYLRAFAAPSTAVSIVRHLLLHEDSKLTRDGVVRLIGNVGMLPDLMKSALHSWFRFQGKPDEDFEKFLVDLEKKKVEAEADVPLASKPQIQ